MKFKSRRHKSENTFRFVPFSERIAAVNVDVSHRIDRSHQLAELADTESHFGAALQKWTELNCTDDFDAFRKEISGNIRTFAQLVHCREQVVAALQKHLRLPSSKALEPLLDLVVKLAQDLQGDFYKHFDEFFAVITELLNASLLDSEILEKAFTCLSYLFKFLWRHMVKDFQHVYRLYSPLLKSSCKEYIRKFASESFAYLMRKVKDRAALFRFMFSLLQEEPEHSVGVGHLLFEMLRGVRQQLHSCASGVLPLLLDCLAENSDVEEAQAADQRLEVLHHTFRLMADHLAKEHSGIVLNALSAYVDKLLSDLSEIHRDHSATIISTLRRVLSLVKDWTCYKSAVLITDCKLLADIVTRCFTTGAANSLLMADHRLSEALLQILCDLLLHRSDMPLEVVSRLLSVTFESGCSRQSLFAFTRTMFSYPMFEKDVLPRLVRYIEGVLQLTKPSRGDQKPRDVSAVEEDVLLLLTQLVLHKQPLRVDASGGIRPPAGVSSFKLDLGVLPAEPSSCEGTTRDGIAQLVVSLLADPKLDSGSFVSSFWAALVCLPHFRLEDRSRTISLLLCDLRSLTDRLLSLEAPYEDHAALFLSFSQLMQTLTGLTCFDDIVEAVDEAKMTAMISTHSASGHVLRAADFFFTAALEETRKMKTHSTAATKAVGENIRLSLLPSLKKQLSSSSSEVRRLSLRILCTFPTKLVDQLADDAVSNAADDRPGVYKICLQAEELECSVHTYRDKLVELRKLDFDNVRSQLPASGIEDDIALRYLLGVLYVNFSLLWDPVIELIRTHARGLAKQTFWDVYGGALNMAAEHCESIASEGPVDSALPADSSTMVKPSTTDGDRIAVSGLALPPSTAPPAWGGSLADLVSAESSKLCYRGGTLEMPADDMHAERADHFNHRELLWRAMQGFAEQCESKSRIIIPLFFNFLEKEYYLADLYAAPTEDLTRQRGYGPAEIGEVKHAASATAKDGRRQKARRPRGAGSALVVHLTLLAKFSNPRSVYWEPRLRALYGDLLCHRDMKVQQLALTCMLAYKDSHLALYADQLHGLLDDAKFKNTLVLFGSGASADDSEAPCLKEADRAAVLPIVIRLLYARMLAKTGKDTAGKAKAGVRRALVLRFLATCRRDELNVFFELLFEPFRLYITQPDNLSLHLDSIAVKVDPHRVVPSLRRQVGVLGALETVMEKLAHLLLPAATADDCPSSCYAREILHVVIGVTRQCACLLEQRSGLAAAPINALKLHLRPVCLTRLTQFFATFESYDFASSELDAVFDAAVWPQLPKLSVEGVYSPTPLLHLLHQWSSNIRYFPLLAKCWLTDSSVSPLSCLMALLVAKTTHQSVCDMIMEIVSNLLSVGTDEEEEAMDTDGVTDSAVPKPLVVNDVVQIVAVPEEPGDTSGCKGATPSYGTCLILPYVSSILMHITKAVQKFKSAAGDRKSKFPSQELSILSSISVYVRDAEQSRVLVQLLLPFLSKGSRLSESSQVDILESVANLVRYASDLDSLESGFAELLSTLTSRAARDALVSLYKKLSMLEPSRWKHAAEIVVKLNAWHHRRLDEPDYDTRLAALQALSREEPSSVGCDIVLARSCMYLISTVDDMSLRDNASFALRSLIQRMSPDRLTAVVIDHVLPDLRQGLRHKSETVRSEFFSAMAALVRKFPSDVPFCDFVSLADATDAEVDFFENLRHIQNHRKARALRRLAKNLSSQPIRAASLTSYMLPIVRSFLEDESFATDSNLIDAAVEALGAICGHLPWRSYQVQLRRYLQQLDRDLAKQKLAVRVFVAVLDAFHFNLSPTPAEGSVTLVAGTSRPVGGLSKTTALASVGVPRDEDSASSPSLPNHDDEADKAFATSAQNTQPEVPIQQCTAATAAKIQAILLNDIIPRLQESLTRKVASDDEHKLTRTGFVEDSEVLRVPVALALLKLFQKLPDEILGQHLSGLLLKVCAFLRSRSRDIRHAARDTLTKMLDCLGPAKFPVVLKELHETLTRGYQLHVLNFTVHSLLKSMIPKLGPGALDSSLETLTLLFNEELFGKVSEEKEVEGITGKLMEAKASKSYDAYAIVARFVSPGALVRFIQPLKEVLDSTHSNKVIKKAQEALRKILAGLVANDGLSAETCLIFIHGVITEALPMLKGTTGTRSRGGLSAAEIADPRLKPPSALLLPKAPGRSAPMAAVGKKTNMHVLIEFGLMLLHALLKKSKVTASDAEHLRMLDPFVEPLAGCMSSKHVRVATAALHCLLWLCRFPLPALRLRIRSIVENLFVMLKNYTSAGAARGDNLELVTLCFKTITVIVREVEYHSIDDGQLLVLLTYVEADLHDHSRQAAAFSLLKAILSRKLVVPEMYDVIEKVATLSVQSDAPHVRLQCRQVVLQFMLDYPLGRKIRRYLEFYVTNLQYGAESGRESVLEMMASMFSSFPQKLLAQFSGMFFVPLAQALVNDESPRCRRLTALAARTLLAKLDSASRDELLAVAQLWLAESKVLLKRLAVQVIGVFVEVEATRFERHLSALLPLLEQYTEPGRYTSKPPVSAAMAVQASEPSAGEAAVSTESTVDLLLFDVLTLFLKIVRDCPAAVTSSASADPKFAALSLPVWENVQRHLLHPHQWVRLAAAQLYGQLFSLLDVRELVLLADADRSRQHTSGSSILVPHLWQDARKRVRDLTADFCTQLHSPLLSGDLADQIIKNLLYLAKVIKELVPSSMSQNEGLDLVDDDANDDIGRKSRHSVTLSLGWLIKRLCREANYEAIQDPKSTIRRSSIFKWFGAVALDLGASGLDNNYLLLMTAPLYREAVSEKAPAGVESLKGLATEVMDLFKTVVGLDAFTEAYSAARSTAAERKESRKRAAAVEAVSHPDIAARKKMKKNLSKKEAKKRQVLAKRPTKGLHATRSSNGIVDAELHDA